MTPPADARTGPEPSECWISVDVETAGPNPGSYSLLSIGACLYDDPDTGFTIELRPVTPAADDSALAVSGLDMNELAVHGVEPAEAMAAFEAWVLAASAGRQPVFLGFNAAFDWMFVCDYFHRFLGRNPFGHAAIDMKAVAMGRYRIPWRQTSFARLTARTGGVPALTHHALQDARDQATLLQAILQDHNVVP